MLNFLILSDSHRNHANVDEAVKRSRNTDAILFLGDGLGDFRHEENFRFRSIPLYCVRGNCDMFSFENAEDELLLHFEEYTVMMMHGHRYGVKSSLSAAAAHAAKEEADVLLFGHTHVFIEKRIPEGTDVCGITLKKPLYLFNPGSIGVGPVYSFGLLTFNGGEVLPSHGNLR